jgi:hypothetical protein
MDERNRFILHPSSFILSKRGNQFSPLAKGE